MKKITQRVLLITAVFALVHTASAQPTAGSYELTLGGGGGASRDFDNGNFGFNAGLGYYFTDAVELSLRQTLGFTDGPLKGDSFWAGSTGVAVDYNFNLDRLRPFIGANVGYNYGIYRDDWWFAAPEAGLKFYVHEKAFIFGMAQYQFRINDGNVDDQFRSGAWAFSVGIGLNF